MLHNNSRVERLREIANITGHLTRETRLYVWQENKLFGGNRIYLRASLQNVDPTTNLVCNLGTIDE